MRWTFTSWGSKRSPLTSHSDSSARRTGSSSSGAGVAQRRRVAAGLDVAHHPIDRRQRLAQRLLEVRDLVVRRAERQPLVDLQVQFEREPAGVLVDADGVRAHAVAAGEQADRGEPALLVGRRRLAVHDDVGAGDAAADRGLDSVAMSCAFSKLVSRPTVSVTSAKISGPARRMRTLRTSSTPLTRAACATRSRNSEGMASSSSSSVRLPSFRLTETTMQATAAAASASAWASRGGAGARRRAPRPARP